MPPGIHACMRAQVHARLVAKYRPSIPVLTVAVPVLTTDSLTWTCSGEQPARQCLVTRGLLPLLAEGSARATDTDTTDEMFAVHCALLPCLLPVLAHCTMRWKLPSCASQLELLATRGSVSAELGQNRQPSMQACWCGCELVCLPGVAGGH